MPKKYCIALIVIFLFLTGKSSAQIGFETSLVNPNGDIGQFYKKNISADLFLMRGGGANEHFRIRMGIFYTNLSPRLDTVPQYAVLIGGTPYTQIVPGYLVDHNFTMTYIYGDFSYKVVTYKKISLYAGLGIEGGKVHES